MQIICRNCGCWTEAKEESHLFGGLLGGLVLVAFGWLTMSFADGVGDVLIALCFLGFGLLGVWYTVKAIIRTFWRRCGECGSRDIVPAHTPAGHELAKKHPEPDQECHVCYSCGTLFRIAPGEKKLAQKRADSAGYWGFLGFLLFGLTVYFWWTDGGWDTGYAMLLLLAAALVLVWYYKSSQAKAARERWRCPDCGSYHFSAHPYDGQQVAEATKISNIHPARVTKIVDGFVNVYLGPGVYLGRGRRRGKGNGSVPLDEFDDPASVRPGDVIDVYKKFDYESGSITLSKREADRLRAELGDVAVRAGAERRALTPAEEAATDPRGHDAEEARKLASIVEGRIVARIGDQVIVDVGRETDGAISIEEFDDPSSIRKGEKIEVYVSVADEETGQLEFSKAEADRLRAKHGHARTGPEQGEPTPEAAAQGGQPIE